MKGQSYSTYKDSGIEWLGEIPEHWEVYRLKYCTDLINERVDGRDSELSYTGLEHIESWTGRRIVADDAAYSDGQASKYRKGDVLFGKLRPYLAKALRAIEDGICTGELLVLRPRRVIQDYLFDYVLTSDFISIVDSSTYGAKMPRANWEFIGNLPILVPPEDEQRAIAAFLDHQTQRIDALIEKKERQIELLQEKRIALIHEAIQNAATRNLRVGYVANQIQRPVKRTDDEIYVPIGLYNRGRGIFHKEPTVGAELGDSDFFWVEANDLILSGQFAWEGAVALAGEEDAGCVATHRYPILRGKPGLMDTAYLFAFFTTKTGDFLLNEHSRGAAGRNRPLNAGTLLKEVIPVPPMAAQLSVSKHVYFERRFRRIVATSIKLLAEYRTALITAAVTGKIDVRGEVV